MQILQGMDVKGMKRYPYIIPIYLCVIFGYGTGISCLVRTALKNPDVTWSRRRNPEPWQEYADKKYIKFLDPAKPRGLSSVPRPTGIWY